MGGGRPEALWPLLAPLLPTPPSPYRAPLVNPNPRQAGALAAIPPRRIMQIAPTPVNMRANNGLFGTKTLLLALILMIGAICIARLGGRVPMSHGLSEGGRGWTRRQRELTGGGVGKLASGRQHLAACFLTTPPSSCGGRPLDPASSQSKISPQLLRSQRIKNHAQRRTFL